MKPPEGIIRLGAQAIIRDDEGRLYLGHRVGGFEPGTWGLFGGEVEIGEEVVQALMRELKEELGLIVRREQIQFFTYADTIGKEHFVQFAFIVDVDLSKQTPTSQEPNKCIDSGWFFLNALPGPIYSASRPFIDKLQKNEQ